MILVDGFVDRWNEKPQQPSFLSKIKDAGKSSEGLKSKLALSSNG
jgi:hypothetical protein